MNSKRWKKISRYIRTWENNIKMHYTEIWRCFLNETKLAVDGIEWRIVMNTVTRRFCADVFPARKTCVVPIVNINVALSAPYNVCLIKRQTHFDAATTAPLTLV